VTRTDIVTDSVRDAVDVVTEDPPQQLRPREGPPNTATPLTRTMRHARHLLPNRQRGNFVRPRFFRIRDAVVDLFLFAVLISLRNDQIPHTRTRCQHTVVCHQVSAGTRH
jgi:hypothetical protein